MIGLIKSKLNNIKEKNENYDYNIFCNFNEFPKVVALGETKKERLQIFIMLYVVSPTLKELEEWELDKLINYIKETDEYYEDDEKYIKECIEIIKEIE